jgi:glycosyltransferase involved in cell wall biosynthesis
MRIVISIIRPFHSVMLSNALLPYSSEIDIYSSAPRRFFRALDKEVRTRFVPSPAAMLGHSLHINVPESLDQASSVFFDLSVAAVMGAADMYFGWATACLQSARAAKRRGARFVLDRACPHRDFQQALVQRETERVGARFSAQPDWFRQRQLEEYELADAILVPSRYTSQSFPAHLQAKLVKAPLSGRCSFPERVGLKRRETFTLGVVGGDPLRKGYLYLFKAWEKLALPNARLLFRAGDFRQYPLLAAMSKRIKNLELVNYVPDIGEFYRRCDVFVLPSVDDGFGMALIEAMANGCACITTTNTGASELLTHGRDALIVNPADEDQLAEAILRLYEAEDFRQALGHSGRQTASSLVSSSAYKESLAALMERLTKPTAVEPANCKASPSPLGRDVVAS